MIQYIPLLFLWLIPCHAATYYISNSGSDAALGTSAGTAWATIEHAVASSGNSDELLLERGSVFRESANTGNRTLEAYGNAADPLPIVSGAVEITGWSRQAGSIYYAAVTDTIRHLYVDNVLMRIARYPNTGWLRTKSWTENSNGTNTVITTTSLAGHLRNIDDYWNGANIRWHRHSWWFETRTITDYAAAGQLSLSDKSLIHIMPGNMDGWGFYLDSKFQELDSAGEWFFDASQMRVYLWAPGGGDPSSLLVEGAMRNGGLAASRATVKNIWFRHQADYGLRIGSTCTVESCRFSGIGGPGGGRALYATWGCGGSLVKNNTFTDNLNVSISWNEDPNNSLSSTIEHNDIINSGTVDGYGGSGSWHAAGIIISNASELHIQYNTIDGTGYAGVILGREGNYVEYNRINNAMATLNDGAGIYTNCSRSTIRYNIITGCLGGMESSGPWANLAHGIWPEFLEDFRKSIIENNTVGGCGGYGLFLPNNFDCSIQDNVFFNNGRAGIELSGKLTNSSTGRTENLPQNHTISGNVFYANDPDQDAILFRPEYDYGIMAGNYVCNPFTSQPVGQWQEGGWSIYPKTLAEWQGAYTWADATAKTDLIKRPAGMSADNPYAAGRLVFNGTGSSKSISLGPAAYQDLDGNPVSGSITVPAWSSRVLVQTDSTAITAYDGADRILSQIRISASAVIRYSLAREQHIRMDLYGPDGALVTTLVNETQSPGTHRVGIPAPIYDGIYIVRVAAGHAAVSDHRLVLVR